MRITYSLFLYKDIKRISKLFPSCKVYLIETTWNCKSSLYFSVQRSRSLDFFVPIFKTRNSKLNNLKRCYYSIVVVYTFLSFYSFCTLKQKYTFRNQKCIHKLVVKKESSFQFFSLPWLKRFF